MDEGSAGVRLALLAANEIQHRLRTLRGMGKRQPVARIREDCTLVKRILAGISQAMGAIY